MTRRRSRSATTEPAQLPVHGRQDSAAHLDGAVVSLASGLGTNADPRAHLQVAARAQMESLTPPQIDSLMREWGPRKYVEEIPADATRRWIDLTVEGEGAPDDAAKRILDRLEELDARELLREALVFERQYGGAALIPWLNDGQNTDRPLRRTGDGTIQGPVEIRRLEVVSRWKLRDPSTTELETDLASPHFGLPVVYQLNLDTAMLPAGLPPMRGIHRDRIHLWRGWRPVERTYRWEWGWSMLEGFEGPWKDYENAIGTGLGLAGRAVETRLALKDLRKLAASGRTAELRAYLAEVQVARSAFKVFIHDQDDTVQDVDLKLSGAQQILEMARDNVAAASGFSAQRFFGLRHQGMSDSDESGAQRDEAEVTRYQRRKLLPALNFLIALIVAEQKLSGVKTWQVTFKPLREETAKQKADRHQVEAQTAAAYLTAQVVLPEEVRGGMRASADVPYQLLEDDELGQRGMLETDLTAAEQRIRQLEAALRGEGSEVDLAAPAEGERSELGDPDAGGVLSGADSVGDAAPAGAESVQDTALNGAQVQAAKDIVLSVANRQLPRDAALGMLATFFRLSSEQAATIMGSVGNGFERAPEPGTQPTSLLSEPLAKR